MMTVDFVAAKLKHGAWKSKMRKFLNGEMTMSEAEAVSPRDCELGKWLYSDGKTNFGNLQEFRELESIHGKLHGYVRDIITKKNAGDVSGAEDQYKLLNTASGRVIQLLDDLDNKVSAM